MISARFAWQPDDVETVDPDEIDKHLPGWHNQDTHAGKRGQQTVINAFKFRKRAQGQAAAVVKKHGLQAVRKLFNLGMEPGDMIDDFIPGNANAKKVVRLLKDVGFDVHLTDKEDRIPGDDRLNYWLPDNANNRKMVFTMEILSGYFGGMGKGPTTAWAEGVKQWMNGEEPKKHSSKILDLMYAATQEHFKTAGIKRITLHRGMAVKKDVYDRLESGEVQSVDVDTIGHWSTDAEQAIDFSRSAGGTRPVVFVMDVNVEDVLFTHKIEDFGFEDEKEVIPLFSARPRVLGKPKEGKYKQNMYSYDPLVVDLRFTKR
jgi:hypothetical protein